MNVSGLQAGLRVEGTAGSRLRVLAALQIKTDVKTLGALLDQFYEKRRLLILSAPNTSDSDYQLQNIMIQVRQVVGFTPSSKALSLLRSFSFLPFRSRTAGWTCDT